MIRAPSNVPVNSLADPKFVCLLGRVIRPIDNAWSRLLVSPLASEKMTGKHEEFDTVVLTPSFNGGRRYLKYDILKKTSLSYQNKLPPTDSLSRLSWFTMPSHYFTQFWIACIALGLVLVIKYVGNAAFAHAPIGTSIFNGWVSLMFQFKKIVIWFKILT